MLYVHILNTLNKNIQISLLIYFLFSYFLINFTINYIRMYDRIFY